MRAPTDQPNIILINCDDLGYGDTGCYGSTLHSTPALDRLAAQGTRFTDFYMAAPVCTPSRGAMMTGCYPPRIGLGAVDNGAWVLFPGHATGLNPEETTVAGLLQQQGYYTKMIGKWHLGDQPEFLPTRHGFDSYYGLPYSNDMGRQVGREHMPPLPLLRDAEVIQEQPDQAALTERYVEEGVRFLRKHQDRPFFLYFAHMYVHLPLYAPDRFLRQSRNGPYGAAVECVDWSIDVLMNELQRLDLEENTIVIFTSDNGSRTHEGGSNDPLRGTKGSTWEGGMRLPFVIRWPGQIPAGRVCSELVTSMDFLPTFARLAGTREPEDRSIDGKDIRPLLFAEADACSPHEAFFYYFKNDLEAVRVGDWKLFVRRWNGPEKKSLPVRELYNLEEDIGETTNLYDQHPEVVAELSARADRCREDLGCQATGIEGRNIRRPGRVEDPHPLTQYDPEHPYIIAMYDLDEAG
ncbi:MAG: sulfatase [Gemmatimonadetes bacterium]|jgi:arylsulfatase A|nr:sulfatase [Gemmatimonadota bacterium]